MARRSVSSRTSNPDVFSDEYSLDAIEVEEDVRPGGRTPSGASLNSSVTLRSTSAFQNGPNAPSTRPELSDNPFGDEASLSGEDYYYRSSLPQKTRDDGDHRNSTVSSTGALEVQRNESLSSRNSVLQQPLTPYAGATGPSHPYGMYPQIGVGRSPSVTTTSTERPLDRPLVDTNPPQHPYAMYPQNVVAADSLDEASIPLGFLGHTLGYRQPALRSTGTDIADIVGPDGHAEQLPPYSRYPDGGAAKAVAAGIETATEPIVVQDDFTEPERRQQLPISETSSRTLVPEESGAGSVRSSTAATPATGLMAFEEKLQRKGKQRVCCGLPVWTLVLVGVVVLILACIGGAIGGVLGARKAATQSEPPPPPTAAPEIITVTATPGMEATPIPSMPYGVLPLPTGTYNMPMNPKNQSKLCVADHAFMASWSCMNAGDIPIEINGTWGHRAITFPTQPTSAVFTYGAQPPVFTNLTQALSPMLDSRNFDLGPALYFFAVMDKLVIVPQHRFPISATGKRADIAGNLASTDLYPGTKVVAVGERPWFCWWNSTSLQFFVYVNQTTEQAQYGPSVTSSTSSVSPSTSSPHLGARDYPRRIKFVEKRDIPGAPQPYCQQMQLLDNGAMVTYSPNTVPINEIQPTPTTTVLGNPSETFTAEAQYESACFCVALTD